MQVLLVGQGAREHALAWKFSQSPKLGKLFLAPGNAAMAAFGERLPNLQVSPQAITNQAKQLKIDLVVCGPEAPLAEGLADALKEAGVPCFGPEQAAAQLEASKAFAKEVMLAAKVPTAEYVATKGRTATATAAMKMLHATQGTVLKASGLAGGKGVFVCKSEADITAALDRFERSMPEALDQVVVEEILVGRECSYFVTLGALGPRRLGFAVDFKRLEDGDHGPNTGGMGCYSPVPWLPPDAPSQVDRLVVEPVVAELKRRGLSYCGCLYVGLMWGSSGPKVVEFNVRLGDPECQVLAAQDDCDWLGLMAAQAGVVGQEQAADHSPASDRVSVAVVMASGGYPYGEGDDGQAVASSQWLAGSGNGRPVFAASIKESGQDILTGSGRVFTVTGSGRDFNVARRQAYDHVARLKEQWPQARVRSDIAALVSSSNGEQ